MYDGMNEATDSGTGQGAPWRAGAVAPATVLAVSLERIERLARALLRAGAAAVVLGDGGMPAAEGGFRAEAPLRMPDGSLAGVLRVRDCAARPPMTAEEDAILADLAAMAVDALERQREDAARQQDIDRLALRERLLRIAADAPSFAIAIDMVMAALREATQSMLCLFFRLGPDGEHLHLVAGQASTPALTAAYMDHLREMDVRTDNSLVGAVAVTGQQQVVSGIDHTALRRYPAIRLSVMQSIVSQVVTPISLGAERYSFSVGFGPDAPDLNATADMLLGLAGTLRPLLRRLRDAEETELFRRVVEASSDSVMISEIGPTGPADPRICYVNAAFSRQTGYRREEVIGRPCCMLQGPAIADAAAEALAAGQPIRRDVLNHRQDGSRFWADSTMAPVTGIAGAVTHWVAIERDITERKLAQESVALNEQRFRLVARATADVVWDWDLAAGTIWWSEGVQTQFGYQDSELAPGFDWWAERVCPPDRQRVVAGRQAAATADTGTQWRDEYRFRKADGSLALVRDHGFVIHDAAGVPVRMVGSMVDITRQRQLEEQLRQSQRLDAVGKLTGGVAHDFNNLLAIIIGNAEMLKELVAPEPALLEPVEMIFAAAERGAELTSRLLSFARLHPLDPKVTDVNRLLAGMAGLVRRLIGANIDIAFVGGEAPALAVIDAPQLENAVLNLCINARDAMPEGGRLRVETGHASRAAGDAPPGGYVTIAVTDTGTGMTPEVASRAFEPFFTTKAFGKGSGLGLSMVFGFVHQSGGQVEIASEVGRGTRVTLRLPRAAGAAAPAEVAAVARDAPGGQGTILLVEDDEAVRRVVANQLEWLGYRVIAVPNGQQGLEVIRTTPGVDVLFTDIVMPGGVSGHQLAQQARALRPSLRVLFTSGYPDDAAPPGGQDSRIGLLQKPYRLVELANKVSQLLEPGGAGSQTGQVRDET